MRVSSGTRKSAADPASQEESPMFDLILLALSLGFFALTVGYAYACERL